MKNSHEKRVNFPEERSAFLFFSSNMAALNHVQTSNSRVTVRRLAENFLSPFFWVIGREEKLLQSTKNVELFANFRLALKLT